VTLDSCSALNAGSVSHAWRRGRWSARLRVTMADGRFGEALTTVLAD